MASLAGGWVDFFMRAGIPSDEAASYALIFTRNRIQLNMLPDLNKEYLKDMGITLLGDIIAILKHATTVHENERRAFVMSQRLLPAVLEEPKSTVSDKSNTTAKNYSEKYAKKYKEPEKNFGHFSNIETKSEPDVEDIAESTPQSYTPVASIQKKRKLKDTEPELKTSKQKKIKTSHEDSKLDKATVFARLGDSSVSSTTSEASAVVIRNMSVFSRLGDLSPVEPIKSTGSSIATPSPKINAPSMRADKIEMEKEKKRPVLMGAKKKTDFLKARDLEMLKITTEFSDDDDVVANDLKPQPKKNPDIIKQTCIRKFEANDAIDLIDSTERTALISEPQPKRVRFGGTTTRILPMEPKKRNIPFSFPNSSFLAKKLNFARQLNKRKQIASLGAVNTTKTNNIKSKMVSDTMKTATSKSSVKKRLQMKNKISILDRLG